MTELAQLYNTTKLSSSVDPQIVIPANSNAWNEENINTVISTIREERFRRSFQNAKLCLDKHGSSSPADEYSVKNNKKQIKKTTKTKQKTKNNRRPHSGLKF